MQNPFFNVSGRAAFCALIIILSLPGCGGAAPPDRQSKPNILLVLLDDIGYADLGVFGSEIDTPNIDQLAAEGVQLTNFYAGATCGPSRSMLLTGVDNHQTGLGTNPTALKRLAQLRDKPGYEGYLNDRVVTIATRLKEAGYFSVMAGKWDLGDQPGQYPTDRGFDRAFALLDAGGSHFNDMSGLSSRQPRARYVEDGHQVHQLPPDFYSSAFYTDRMIEYLSAAGDRPFFGYLAYTAGHWPLQVPDSWLDRYRGAYARGWDAIRAARFTRMKKTGVIPDRAVLPPRLPIVQPWSEMSPEQQRIEARRMELYASMLTNLDDHLGRLIKALKEQGRYKDTLIILLSDNGPEGNDIENIADNRAWIPKNFDNSMDNMGRKGSFVWQGPGWGQVSATPLNLFKSFVSEGGVRVPAIISQAGRYPDGRRTDTPSTVLDIPPTLLDLAGLEAGVPSAKIGNKLSMAGTSLRPLLEGSGKPPRSNEFLMGWEAYGNRALRLGSWKANLIWPPMGPGKWQLHNLAVDPGEQQDLAGQESERLNKMVGHWNSYADRVGVHLFEADMGYGRYRSQP